MATQNMEVDEFSDSDDDEEVHLDHNLTPTTPHQPHHRRYSHGHVNNWSPPPPPPPPPPFPRPRLPPPPPDCPSSESSPT